MKRFANIALACVLFFAGLFCARAQVRDAEDVPSRIRPFADMWTVRTNAFEWVAIIPNAGAEFDLTNSIYNRHTLGLTAKYNWRTTHKLVPSLVYDIFELRPEYRYYTCKFDDLLKYIGAYANYTRYAFLLGKTGYQGTAAGLGVSGGYVFNLYTFTRGALDLELGASVGLQVTDHEAFTHDRDGYFYKPLPEKSRFWHVTPFPVVSEVRAALCWRHLSATQKYRDEDPLDVHFRQDRESMRAEIHTWRKESFDNRMSKEELEAYAADDYAYRRDFVQYVNSAYEDGLRRYADFDSNPERMSRNHRKRLAGILKRARSRIIHEFDAALRKDGRQVIRKDPAAKAAAKTTAKAPKKAKPAKETQTKEPAQ